MRRYWNTVPHKLSNFYSKYSVRCILTHIPYVISKERFMMSLCLWISLLIMFGRFEEHFEYDTSFFEWVWTGIFQNEPHLTSTRVYLSTTTVSALLFVRVVGQPLPHFSATKYVESWIPRGPHSAVDTNSKERARDSEYDENMVKALSFLYFFRFSYYFLFCFMRKYIEF
jgi:hypothetical protein